MDIAIPHPRLNLYFSVFLALLFWLLLLANGAGLLAAIGGSLLGWLLYYASCTGQEISADKQFTRAYVGWPGLHLGAWQPLPPVVGVTLKYFSQMGGGPAPGRTSWGVWDTSGSRYAELVLLLSVAGSATGFIIGRYPLDELPLTLQQGRATADYLGVPFRTYVPPHIVSLP